MIPRWLRSAHLIAYPADLPEWPDLPIEAATPEVRTLAVSVNRSASEAYAFLSAPENFAKCFLDAGAALHQASAGWVAQTAEGLLTVHLTDRNSLGVLDYSCTPQGGPSSYVPLRVVTTAKGCDLVMTLFRRPDISDERLASATERARQGLDAAKHMLEKA
jgi:hypothetical protein